MSFHAAVVDEPLLSEYEFSKDTSTFDNPIQSKSLKKNEKLSLPLLDETQVVRHFHHLSQLNFGVDNGMYPLGSCTMKYNPKICERIASWPKFSCMHPLQDESTIQGSLELMYELELMFCEICGMDAFSLQPAAGAQGEFTGILLAKAFHEANNESERNEIILPDTAHGTNPASAALAGYKLVEIPSNEQGRVDLEVLKKTVSNKTALFMLTNPNTLGIFESDIVEIAKIVHDAGGLLYYDGANMNAIMGRARPGDMGFDIVHLNLHKTFSTPHGGGGPGSGPVGVKRHLEAFLPVPRVIKDDERFHLCYEYADSIGKVRSWYGNFSVLLKSYVYLALMGGNGLRESSDVAVLNSNYMKHKILSSGCFQMPYGSLRKHEFVLSAKDLLEKKGIRASDVAKRLLDFGLHAPTMYFPLIVKEALMIEPTESESKESLDYYCDILCKISNEQASLVKSAPRNTVVGRVDEAKSVKDQIFSWFDMK